MRKGAAPALHRAAGSRRRSGSLPGAGCFLRDAIQSANLDSNFGDCVGVGPYGNDLIVFDPSVATVTLTNTTPTPPNNDNNEYLDLDIHADTGSGALTVDGGSNGVTVQAGPGWGDRIFDIVPGPQPTFVVLRNLIVQGGSPPAAAVETGIGGPCFNSGGGVRNRSGGNLTLDTVIVQNNTMPMNGGGVCHQLGGVLTIQNSHVISNTAGRAGGGVWENAAQFTLQNSQVLSNTVNGLNGIGGGIVTQGGATPKTILTSTVAYNRADGDGGGIYNQTARGLQVSGSTVLSNTAGAFLNQPASGGGIWSGSRLNLNNTDVLSNAALISGTTMMALPFGGGGIYQQSQQVTINGGQVGYNVARSFVNINVAGGGVWNSGQANLQNNVRVISNRAVRSPSTFAQAFGGGIYNVDATMSIANSSVEANYDDGAQAYGDGIASVKSSGAPQISVQSSAVSTNTAQGDPGFGNAQGGGIYGDGTLEVSTSELRNNRANGGQTALGGGVFSSDVLTLTSSPVISNAAMADPIFGFSGGGGVESSGSAVLITGTQVLTNVAGQGGGWRNSVSGAQMRNSEVRFNRTLSDSIPNHGGGIYNSNTGSGVSIQSSQIADNRAVENGGGIYNAGPDVFIQSSQIADNQADQDGGGIYNAAGAFVVVIQSHALTNTAINGGGLYNMGGASVGNSVFGANQASQDGGGLYNDAGALFMSINDSQVLTNTAINGGGFYNAGNAQAFGSVFGANQASQNGGGLYNAAAATNLFVGASTFDGNSANDGGGVYNAGPANLSNSALVNNTASNGGGAYNTGVLESVNNTLSGNSAPDGSGLLNNLSGSAYLTHTTVASNTNAAGIRVAGGTVQVLASLVAYHTTGGNCSGSVTENGSSLSSDVTCGVTFSNTNPLLQPLALNGGQTLNHALSPGSPALDVVPLPCAVGGDQRFVGRPQGTACDIGAFELEEADLEVSKSADPSPVIAGQTITYTVIVTNVSASGAANNVVLTDTLAGGATFGGVVSGGGFALQSSTSSQAIFTLSSLSAGMSATLVFTATAPASGPINNTATVASSNPDPVLSNNTASVATPVTPAAYLQATKSQSYTPYAPGVILPGGQVVYTILVTNTGPSTVTMSVQDTLAGGVAFVAASITPGTCGYSAPTVSCNTGALIPAGGSATALITVTAPITSSTVFTNVANAFAPAFPGTPFSSNVVTLTTAAQAELRAFKSATPSPVYAGQPVTYVVTVQNFGPDPAANVVITDVFQGGATFGSVVGTSGGATLQSSSAGGVTFTVPSLGASSMAMMTYTVIAPADGVITNTITASSDALDPNPSNNSFTTTTPVTPAANLQIGKAVTTVTNVTGTVRPGGALTYTLLVTNTGPSSASFITVTDSLPTGLTYVSATGAGWSCSFSAPTVTCTTSTLSVGAAPAIQIVATAPVTPGLALTNTASVTAATYPAATVNSNSVTVKVQYRVYAPIARKP
ncbi:MAG: choice-of-anchor Q domain-containing protein [Thermoflexales bacterium]